MKRPVQFMLITVLYLVALISCTNSSGNDNTEQHADQSAKSQPGVVAVSTISFKVNGSQVNSSEWNISRSVMSNMLVLNITSNMHIEPRTINININGDKPGTYNFSGTAAYNMDGAAYGSYYPDYKEDMTNSYRFEEGTFTITSVDTAAGILNAEFSGIAKNNKGEAITITNGIVSNGQLKQGVTKY